MAKLKGPLFSLGASQQIGKALVYFPWKGLNVVREYVVPSNPKTTGQQTQRGYVTAAVAKIHAQQAAAASPLGETDVMAYALWASTYPTPRTWFNQAVKHWIDRKVLAKVPGVFRGGVVTPGNDQLTFKLIEALESGAITNLAVFWGTSKTALINSQAVTKAELNAGIAITGMPDKTKVFMQARVTLPTTHIDIYSGLYYGLTT